MEKFQRILKYFRFQHLPAHLQEVSKPFSDLATIMVKTQVDNDGDVAETMAGLRKLLEAKDCSVRSIVK